MFFNIRKGLDIPLAGVPAQAISDTTGVSSVALFGPDTIDLKPKMLVATGDIVKLGQPLFIDKQNPGVKFTSPGSGRVIAINRGERRVLQSVVVELAGDAQEQFARYDVQELQAISRQDVQTNLLDSGLWTSLRTRPFNKVPPPDSVPVAIFVTAIDTNPLAANPEVIVQEDPDSFAQGLTVLGKLTDGKVHVCTAPNGSIARADTGQISHSEFSGPHPAGLAGTHIHFLEPVDEAHVVWHLGYQDVIAIGKLFATGRLPIERVISLGGPLTTNPRLLRTRMGANVLELTQGEVESANLRIVAGSVLNGRRAAGWAAWLGRYDNQVTVLEENKPREFLSWMRPGIGKFSATRSFVGNLLGGGPYALTASQNGSPRAMVSIGSFEQVMPLDILPTPLLKALLVRDTDTARDLGCLELAEEDLALCSFVCNGKYVYGPHLRKSLHEIEVNG